MVPQARPILRASILAAFFLLLPAGSVASSGFCPSQPVHTYGPVLAGKAASVQVHLGGPIGFVSVLDTNAADCNGDEIPFDWDGDMDAGTGGGFFGYGPWATDPDCNYDLNVQGPNVAINDFVWGSAIAFFVGEDDQAGPIKIQDPVTLEYTCTTDGNISPCPSAGCDPFDPTQDADDCLSEGFVGTGATCGTGGGDGGYWVIMPVARVNVEGATGSEAYIDCETLLPPGCSVSNPPTTGTLTAF